MSERTIRTLEDLRTVLDAVTFAPSCVALGWTWQTTRVHEGAGFVGPDGGWLVRTSFTRPDTLTGEIGVGYGRWEFVAVGASESAVVKTCWLLAELVVRHELMEAFLYRGARLFDPHRTVEELAAPGHAVKEVDRLRFKLGRAAASLAFHCSDPGCLEMVDRWRASAAALDADELPGAEKGGRAS